MSQKDIVDAFEKAQTEIREAVYKLSSVLEAMGVRGVVYTTIKLNVEHSPKVAEFELSTYLSTSLGKSQN